MTHENDAANARAALESVALTDRKMATHMHWPFRRHATFGLTEGLLVTGLGIAGPIGVAACGVGVALVPLMVQQDKRRHGMFVSGWSSNRARPIVFALLALLLPAIALSLYLRWDSGVNPLVVLLGIAVAITSTWASIRWEKLYRAELEESGRS